MNQQSERTRVQVLSAPIDVVNWSTAIARIQKWAAGRESRYVCICNVHSVITARQDISFRRILSEADMATPDGAPIAWMLRYLGFSGQQRISGPDLMWFYCEQAAKRDESIFLYGGSHETLDALRIRLMKEFPGLRIAGVASPPFRPLTEEEDKAEVEKINASGAGTVWVGLGCPKQERWMASHQGKVRAVMIGVGAAFDFHAGIVARAPLWMRNSGLEWFYRLCSEPRRLWRRYLVTNILFILLVTRQVLFGRS